MASSARPYWSPPLDPSSKIAIAKEHLVCIESVLLNVKAIKNYKTAESELLSCINSIEIFLNKAKDLLKEKE